MSSSVNASVVDSHGDAPTVSVSALEASNESGDLWAVPSGFANVAAGSESSSVSDSQILHDLSDDRPTEPLDISEAGRRWSGVEKWGLATFPRVFVPLLQFVAGLLAATRTDRIRDLRRLSATSRSHFSNILVMHGMVTCGSLLLWQHVVSPSLHSLIVGRNGDPSFLVNKFFYFIVSAIFHLVWAVPQFFVATIENGAWLRDVATRAFAVFVLRRRVQQQVFQRLQRRQRHANAGIGKLPQQWAEAVYASTFIITLLLVQSVVSWVVPGFVGFAAAMLVLSWAYALICFEYRWPDKDLDLRLRYVEANWAYFYGFGLAVAIPPAVADWWGGFLLSYGIWYLMLPLFVVNAIGAARPPHDRPADRKARQLFVFSVANRMNTVILRLLVWVVVDGLPLLSRAARSLRFKTR